jgi:hypothetical protein
MTFADLQLETEGPEGNRREVLKILNKMKKVDMVSNIASFDANSTKFDDVMATSKKLLEKKDNNKTEEMWTKIITIAQNKQISPRNEIEALHYEDRREFFKTFTERFASIHELREVVKTLKDDGKESTDWQPDQAKLNNLILQTDMDLEQLDDTLLENRKYLEFFEENIKDKDFFKTALAYQEVVEQSYETYYL